MNTISALYPNAVTVSTPTNRESSVETANVSREFERSSFTPVKSNESISESNNRGQQRPEQELAASRFTDIQQQRIEASRLKDNLEKNATSASNTNEQNLNSATDKQNTQSEQSKNNQQTTSNQQSVRRQQQIEQQEQQQIRELAQRDQEVRNHEQAHVSVGGQYTGAASFQYERGPDGVNYAVSGEVEISMSRLADPYLTLEKMKQVKQAALAPAEPSSQDIAVAAKATQLELEAYSEIAKLERNEKQEQEKTKENEPATDSAVTDNNDVNKVEDTFKTKEDKDKQQALIRQLNADTQEITEQALAVEASKNPQQNVGLNLDVLI